MERRRFVVTAGSTILSASALSYQTKPAMGLQFELAGIPDKNPSDVESLQIKFSELKITPKYIDETKETDVQTTIILEKPRVSSSYTISRSIDNGETIDVKNDINPIIIDDIDIPDDQDSIKGKIKININHSSINEEYKQSFIINSANEVWDDWADNPNIGSFIDQRKSFSELEYQGTDSYGKSPTSGLRPEWEITQGDASVNDSNQILSLSRNCLVEYDSIDLSTVDISNKEIIIRFEYEYYNGQAQSSDAGFNLTVNNPGGGNPDNFGGYPEDGYTMYFGGGPVYDFVRTSNGNSNTLIDGAWDEDTNTHISELRINNDNNGLHFEYFYDGTSQGTIIDDTYSLDQIDILHWGNRDSTDADNNPVGINWLEIFAQDI